MWQLFIALIWIMHSVANNQQPSLIVKINEQCLYLVRKGKVVKQYAISTSGTGIGDEPGSYKTPLGKHRIHKKIGAGTPVGTIFKTGINTKRQAQIFTQSVPLKDQEDLITTRIFQLEGLEEKNKHSFARGIWVHGTPYEGNIGKPCSHGCMRMRNHDICELYELIEPGTILDIVM